MGGKTKTRDNKLFFFIRYIIQHFFLLYNYLQEKTMDRFQDQIKKKNFFFLGGGLMMQNRVIIRIN